VQPVDQALAESFGLAGPRGALVGSVQNGSPAGRAGLQPGDVILKYDGRAVERSDALPAMVAATRPGTKAALEVWRNGRVEKLEVEVGEREAPKQLADAKGAVGQGKLGVSVRPLTPEERKEAKLDGGVVVESVAGPAAKAGVRPGDVIVAVNRTPITGVEALRELVQKSDKSVALLIQRDDERLFVPVRLG
jgi:serine protease Do